MLQQLLPEDMSLKQYCGLALGEESALVARLHFEHSPYGCRFHPEHLCRMGIVGGCQSPRGFTAACQQFPCALSHDAVGCDAAFLLFPAHCLLGRLAEDAVSLYLVATLHEQRLQLFHILAG